ncbi:MAG: hypothetical protein AAB071_00145 [Bacteroidota bacterium]
MNTATTILNDLGYSEQQALHNFALLNASQKTAELEQENLFFQMKYKANFTEFEKMIQLRDEEIFEQEDDYLAWKFAVEGIDYWTSKISELQNEH